MFSKAVLIAALVAYAEARFGQEQVPIPAISAVKGGAPGEAATIAGAAISDLLGAANACAKLQRADEVVSQLGGGADAIAAAIGLVTAEKNTNPFANNNTQNVCGDASLPVTMQLRGITPLIDPAVDVNGAAKALSASSAAKPLNAAGMSVFDLMKAAGLGNLVASQAAGPNAAVPAGGAGNNQQASNQGTANTGNQQASNQCTGSTGNQQASSQSTANTGNQQASNQGMANNSNQQASGQAAANNSNQQASNQCTANNSNQQASSQSTATTGNQQASNQGMANKGNQQAGNKGNANKGNQQAGNKGNANKGNQQASNQSQNANAGTGASCNAGNANNGTQTTQAASGNANQNTGNANQGAAGAAATGTAATGGANFGKCTPTIKFEAGQNGRAATEFTFQITDPIARGGQQDALNPNIITNALCNQLTNVCGANAAAISTCLAAKAKVAAAGTRDKSTADLFNTAIGFPGAVTNPDGGPADRPAATPTPAAGAAARKMRRGSRF